MTTIKLKAYCSHKIGEIIVISRQIHPPELSFRFPAEEHTITDIVCQYSAKAGEVVFLYELDGRGPLVQIKEPWREKRHK